MSINRSPIEGISFEQYATIQAKMSQGKSQAELLQEYSIENVSWEKACIGWADRMREDDTYALVTEYGQFFNNTAVGQFAETGKEVANALSTKQAAKGDEPMSLEQYVEIMCAQSAAALQGKDVLKVAESYGINAADYGTVGMYWSTKMASDMNVANQFSKLYAKYEAKFNSGSASDDISF